MNQSHRLRPARHRGRLWPESMIKLTTIQRPMGPMWHVLVAHLPGDWFLGERRWPQDGRPVMLLKAFGPLQFRLFLTHDEVESALTANAGGTRSV